MDARQGLALFDACAKDVKKAFPDGRSLTGQPFAGYLKNFRIRLAQRYAFLGRTLHSPVAYIFVTRLSPTEMEVSLGAEGYAPVLLKTVYLLNMPETTVTVLDSSGRQITTLNSQAGSSRIQWNIKKNLIPGSNQIRPKDNLHTYRHVN